MGRHNLHPDHLDTLSGRMKAYEAVSDHVVGPGMPIVVRVDGRGFSAFTKWLSKPFDTAMVEAMLHAAVAVSEEMTGFQLAYAQSDEVTFVLDGPAEHERRAAWFGGRVQKLASVTASLFTAHFNHHWYGSDLAVFDARAFGVPAEDVPNAIVWRQQDWRRNRVQMMAHAHLGPGQVHGVALPRVAELLRIAGHDPEALDDRLLHGSFVLPGGRTLHQRADYAAVARWLAEPRPQRPVGPRPQFD